MTELFTMAEVMEKWKVSNDTISLLIKKGELQGIKMGRDWRFTQDQLDSYLEKRTVGFPKRKKATLA